MHFSFCFPGGQCRTCGKVLSIWEGESLQIGETLADLVSDNQKDKPKLRQFYKGINSLLNQKGGCLVIHARSTAKLDVFHQKVDGKLCSLIPDHSLYTDVYDFSFLDDQHIVYRVRPLQAGRLYSVLDFRSRTSLNSGRGVLTPFQAAQILATEKRGVKRKREVSVSEQDVSVSEQEVSVSEREVSVSEREVSVSEQGVSVSEQEVSVSVSEQEVSARFTAKQQALSSDGRPLHESSTVEAKAVQENKPQLADHCWYNLHLPEYISAFAKNQDGGSIYFGLKEIDFAASPGKPKAVILVPEEVDLTPAERRSFKENIFERVKNEMAFVGTSSPSNPIDIIFHDVQEAAENACVIEVKVKFYDGLCFASSKGPELYRYVLGDQPGEANDEAISITDWYENGEHARSVMKDYCSSQSQKNNHVFTPPHENIFSG